jgi:hypothetical protein
VNTILSGDEWTLLCQGTGGRHPAREVGTVLLGEVNIVLSRKVDAILSGEVD